MRGDLDRRAKHDEEMTREDYAATHQPRYPGALISANCTITSSFFETGLFTVYDIRPQKCTIMPATGVKDAFREMRVTIGKSNMAQSGDV
jgi:hypothetical protein